MNARRMMTRKTDPRRDFDEKKRPMTSSIVTLVRHYCTSIAAATDSFSSDILSVDTNLNINQPCGYLYQVLVLLVVVKTRPERKKTFVESIEETTAELIGSDKATNPIKPKRTSLAPNLKVNRHNTSSTFTQAIHN
jgi:hypothetical protein